MEKDEDVDEPDEGCVTGGSPAKVSKAHSGCGDSMSIGSAM